MEPAGPPLIILKTSEERPIDLEEVPASESRRSINFRHDNE